MLKKLTYIFDRPHLVHALLLFAMTGLALSAVVLERIFEAHPCEMCWWQRYVHWTIGGIGFSGFYAGWIAKNRIYTWPVDAYKYVIGLALMGGSFALWQGLSQRGIIEAPESCQAANIPQIPAGNLLEALQSAHLYVEPPCDVIDLSVFGLSIADWNVLAMAGVVIGIGWAWVHAIKNDL